MRPTGIEQQLRRIMLLLVSAAGVLLLNLLKFTMPITGRMAQQSRVKKFPAIVCSQYAKIAIQSYIAGIYGRRYQIRFLVLIHLVQSLDYAKILGDSAMDPIDFQSRIDALEDELAGFREAAFLTAAIAGLSRRQIAIQQVTDQLERDLILAENPDALMFLNRCDAARSSGFNSTLYNN
jgi:hypothetical protein